MGRRKKGYRIRVGTNAYIERDLGAEESAAVSYHGFPNHFCMCTTTKQTHYYGSTTGLSMCCGWQGSYPRQGEEEESWALRYQGEKEVVEASREWWHQEINEIRLTDASSFSSD